MISTVQEAMTENVVTIEPSQTIEIAARLMTRYGISSLIVHDNENTLGILTEKDIMMRVVAVGQDPKTVLVSDIMSHDIVRCNPDTLLEDACRTMKLNKIKKLAVFDDTSLKGIISLTDIAELHPELMEKVRRQKKKTPGRNVEDIINLIQRDEGNHLEFKASLRYDKNRKDVNPNLEVMVLKTICAFLNADGGTLLIGLTDDKKVNGVEDDYRYVKNNNRDGFQNHLMSLVSNCVGDFYLKYIDIAFHNLLGKDMCQVNIGASSKPAYLINKGKQEFYVRTGNASRPFKISEAADYLRERWG